MTLPGSLMVYVCLEGGELRQRLNAYSNAAHVQVLFDFDAMSGQVRSPPVCPLHPVTANQAIERLLIGTGFTWEWIASPRPTLIVRPITEPCRPEWGERAPVWPCAGPALVVRRGA